ncbi:hypothetical protein AtubIFM56815_001289 [Aspergillus tubingensis]|uniref:G domain-containing protein n=1 Tax=Aspergillus tubingensis TaxID=5068 RepID=A0A9W6AFZ1_ASPTU|nr:hypothetical protein AtubIFM56815_001289 [Aspergillus tubingensis]
MEDVARPRSEASILSLAQLHFVAEQTAKHERYWEGKVNVAEFKAFIDSIEGKLTFTVSKGDGDDDHVVPDSMLVDQEEQKPESEREADSSDEDVPMADPAEESLACGIKDAENEEIIALENAVANGADVLKELYAVCEGSAAFGTETDWKAEIERIKKYACTEKVIIGVVGSTGAGKSSLINAVLDEKNVLSTDCMRASTAVATEISYNYGSTKYRAEVEFIKHSEWERELEVLFEELRDNQEEVTRGAMLKNSDAAVALDKIQAVYPMMTADNILNTSAADLMANRRVTDLLGTTKAFEGNHPGAFSTKLKSYTDSKGKRGRSMKSARDQNAAEHPDSASDTDTANYGIGLWPLVRVVRIYLKAPALATGAVLVDLPGIFDSNAARVAVAEDYMRRCSAHWIVAPINRAVDDKVARDLLGKNYKSQMQMDCAFNDMTFICTKTDDIDPTEVIQSLGLDLPAFNEVQQLPARVESMKNEIDSLKESKKQISTQLDWIETEIEELEERLNDEFGCEILEITPKRKKPHGHEPSETSAVYETNTAELSEVDKLKHQFLERKVERRSLRSQRKHINKQMEDKEVELQKLEDGKKDMEHIVLSSCIEARNKFSKCQIKRGFALEIQSLDQEFADDAENPTQAPIGDYDELERNLPVFCVSTRAYQSLRGRSDLAKVVGGFSQLEETEIPFLQQHCVKLTENAREESSRRFLTQLNELFQSMTLWYSARSAANVSEQRVKELKAGLECALDALDEDMKAHKNRFNRNVRNIFHQNILSKLSGASRHVILQFPEAVSRWNEGFRWMTYKAICRRRGVYRTTDWNRDLARPLFDKIAAAWRRTFTELLPHAMLTLTDELEVVLGKFHREAIDSVQQDVSDETKKRLQGNLVACQQSMRQRFLELGKSTTLEQKRISRAFAEAIAERLEKTYRACASETGAGSLKRSRALMQQVADDHADDVLRGSTDHAKHELMELLDSQEAEVDRIIQSRLRKISRDYHGALIVPQIRMCSEEQVRIKSEVEQIIQRAEAKLQLGHLLGGVRSS